MLGDFKAAEGGDDPEKGVFLLAPVDTPLTKLWYQTAPDGTPYGRKRDVAHPATFEKLALEGMGDLDEIAQLMRRVPANAMLIRGALEKGTRFPVARIANRNSSDRAFIEAPRRWLMVDIDGDKGSPIAFPGDWLDDPEHWACEALEEHLPQEFHDAGVVVQFSNGMRAEGGYPKMHLFFMLSRPVWSWEVKHWLGPYMAGKVVDEMLYNAVQPHFVANPLFSTPSTS